MEKIPCAPMLGADIEAFVYNESNKAYVPCVGLLPGTKDAPAPLAELPEGYAVQEDNVMAEFNIPPASDAYSFMSSVRTCASSVWKMLPPDHLLVFEPSVKFRPIDLQSEQAKRIGCEPDFDAYTGGTLRTNPPPLTLFRGAGGHVHLGGNFNCPDFVAALFAELYIGLFAGQSGNTPTSDTRARWYGQPGVYRPKPYGIEYRTPSCMWAATSDGCEYVGEYGLRCARWLTDTEAVGIQEVFRAIPWREINAHMRLPSGSTERRQDRTRLLQRIQQAGLKI